MELPQKPVVLVGAREILGVVKETRIGFALTGQFGKTYHLNEMDIAGAFTQPKYADGINYLVVDKDHLDLVGAFKELNPRIRAYAVAASPDEIRPEDRKFLAGIIKPPVITATTDVSRAPDGGFKVVRFAPPSQG